MNKTKIPWCDYTWNPITGCSPASEGCANCYASAMAKRFHRPWGVPVFHPEKLDEPLKVKEPSRIFVCSTGDLFHEKSNFNDVREVLARCCAFNLHTFIILTKRPHMMLDFCKCFQLPSGRLPSNLWIGVSVENQARADERIPVLLKVPSAVHFISAEPLLGPINLRRGFTDGPQAYPLGMGLNWVIAGPETGPKKRPYEPSWIADLYAQCRMNGCAFFDKRDNFPNSCREWPR